MTKYLAPLTDEEKRLGRRLSTSVLQNGEYVSFDIMFRDSLPHNPSPLLDHVATDASWDAALASYDDAHRVNWASDHSTLQAASDEWASVLNDHNAKFAA